MGPQEGCAAEARLIAADRYVMLVPEGGGDAAAMACRLVLAAAFTSMGMQFQSIAAVAGLQVEIAMTFAVPSTLTGLYSCLGSPWICRQRRRAAAVGDGRVVLMGLPEGALMTLPPDVLRPENRALGLRLFLYRPGRDAPLASALQDRAGGQCRRTVQTVAVLTLAIFWLYAGFRACVARLMARRAAVIQSACTRLPTAPPRP